MSNETRIAWRMGAAIALTLFIFFLLHIPNSFRALNTVAMLCGITVFQHGMMKQRLILIWISGVMGMSIDALFRDAPWFYLPAYMLLIYTTMHLASRSRDAATMMLLVFGYSGSVPTSDFFAVDPIIAGFQRTIGVTIGVLVAIIVFYIFPVKNRAAIHQLEPVRFVPRIIRPSTSQSLRASSEQLPTSERRILILNQRRDSSLLERLSLVPSPSTQFQMSLPCFPCLPRCGLESSSRV